VSKASRAKLQVNILEALVASVEATSAATAATTAPVVKLATIRAVVLFCGWLFLVCISSAIGALFDARFCALSGSFRLCDGLNLGGLVALGDLGGVGRGRLGGGLSVGHCCCGAAVDVEVSLNSQV